MAISGVYLIHFDSPLSHARHYIGYASNIPKRLELHKQGQGSRLLKAVQESGIGYKIVRLWTGKDGSFERKLKSQGGAAHLCPLCSGQDRKRKAEWARANRQDKLRKREKLS